MNTPISPSNCPRCGAKLIDNSVDGLCARCLGSLNFVTDTALPNLSHDNLPDVGSTPKHPVFSPEELAVHFPQLEIIELLGRGGMGVVYKARQKSLGRLVALKLLAPERADDPQFAQRFTQEARALAALSHPNIVTIHDFGQAGGFYYLLMEFVNGVNLRQAMNAGRLKPEQALAIVPPVCDALQYAHDHQIVHRDIKPENLLLDKEGRVKIADFGIAKMLGAESLVDFAESQPAGTPQYMAPEQKLHLRTDHRADIYSLGVVLYEMLTGELPTAKLQPPSQRVRIDVRIDEIVLRALESKPELRFSTADEFRAQVHTVTSSAAIDDASINVGETKPYPSSLPISRHAIMGAGWIAATVFAFCVACATIYMARRGAGVLGLHGPTVVQWMVLIPALVFMVAGPVITTLLGWVAMRRIRESNGQTRGLPLAIFDALLYPLAALNGLFVLTVHALAKMFSDFYSNQAAVSGQEVALTTRLANWVDVNEEVVVLSGIGIGIAISIHIMRGVHQAVRLPIRPTHRKANAAGEMKDLTVASVAMVFALISFALGCLCALRQPTEGKEFMMVLSVVMASLAILMSIPMRRSMISHTAIVIAGLSIVLWPLFALVVANERAQVAQAHQLPVPPTRSNHSPSAILSSIPDYIDFKLQRVEHVPGSRKIVIHFERDRQYGLGLEFSQDVLAGPDEAMPSPGYRDFRQKMLLGVNDARQFAWELPKEFDEQATQAAVRAITEQGKKYSKLPDGALIQFAELRHPEGWTYILWVQVRREWGAPYPPPPDGELFSVEKGVIVPADTLVRLRLEMVGNDSAKQNIGDPLLLKTAQDRATGFVVRWHAYGESGSGKPKTVVTDIVDKDSDIIYHRATHTWPEGVQLSSPDQALLPDRNESLRLDEPSTNSSIDLVRIEQLTSPEAAVAIWWTLTLEVSNLGMRSDTEVPKFQLPSHVKSKMQ